MDYHEYLKSKEWKELRLRAYKRAHHQCELCKRPAAAVHHVKYPKQYPNDSIENLLVVCKRCHNLVHGIREHPIKKILRWIMERGYLADKYVLEELEKQDFEQAIQMLENWMKLNKEKRIIKIENWVKCY